MALNGSKYLQIGPNSLLGHGLNPLVLGLLHLSIHHLDGYTLKFKFWLSYRGSASHHILSEAPVVGEEVHEGEWHREGAEEDVRQC